MKLLIVDDSASFRHLVMSLFPVATTQFVECADGGEAVLRYGKEQPDWVLMDIEMNGMDGLSATATIRTSYPMARILILTQYDDPDLRATAQKAGACAYILKDNLAELRQLIAESLGANLFDLRPVEATPPSERNLL